MYVCIQREDTGQGFNVVIVWDGRDNMYDVYREYPGGKRCRLSSHTEEGKARLAANRAYGEYVQPFTADYAR